MLITTNRSLTHFSSPSSKPSSYQFYFCNSRERAMEEEEEFWFAGLKATSEAGPTNCRGVGVFLFVSSWCSSYLPRYAAVPTTVCLVCVGSCDAISPLSEMKIEGHYYHGLSCFKDTMALQICAYQQITLSGHNYVPTFNSHFKVMNMCRSINKTKILFIIICA